MSEIKTVIGRSMWEQLHDAGKQAQSGGNIGEAMVHFRNAAEVAARVDPNDPRRAVSLRYLGTACRVAGRHEEAARAFSTALDVIEVSLAADAKELEALHADYVQTLHDLGRADRVADVDARLAHIAKRKSRSREL